MELANNQTLRDLYLNHYEPKRLLGASEKTRFQYLMQIGIFGRFLGHDATTADLNDDTVCRFMAWQLSRGRRPATANKARTHLLALWRFLAAQRIVDKMPEVPKIPEPEEIPRAWSRHELSQLLAMCRAKDGWIAGIPASAWWHTLHLVMWDTGERVGALRGIEWSDVNLDERWLTVRAELRKGRRKPRMYRLHAKTIDGLRSIVEPVRRLVVSSQPLAAASWIDWASEGSSNLWPIRSRK